MVGFVVVVWGLLLVVVVVVVVTVWWWGLWERVKGDMVGGGLMGDGY